MIARPGLVPVSLEELAGKGLVTRAAARERTLSVLPALGGLLPGAVVQRGSVVACDGPAAVALALAVAAGPSQEGAWVGIAGFAGLGLAAVAEAGVSLARLVRVAEPSAGDAPWSDTQWGDVLAAMIDGFDVLLLGPGVQRVRTGTVRRLIARLQARGAVAVTVGAPVFGGDLRLAATHTQWVGLGEGHGVARSRRVAVEATGRRVPRPRRADLWLPAAGGAVEAVVAVPPVAAGPVVVPLRHTG